MMSSDNTIPMTQSGTVNSKNHFFFISSVIIEICILENLYHKPIKIPYEARRIVNFPLAKSPASSVDHIPKKLVPLLMIVLISKSMNRPNAIMMLVTT